ncbi:hypothetical protein C5O75_020955 [Burkholderia cepacia]|uniref:hypothetical protein n=1 Tax=Burkholderia cepacia TaxID=292 RepID=UPI000D4FB1C7|nr:hypothetical protein [Burkholderia cepacia]KAB1589990.1 hypothetical protein C5O75_020955 [Burkholderia cepacia]
MKAVQFKQHEIETFMKYLASHQDARREMLVACGLSLVDILEDEIGETAEALAVPASETICERRPDLVRTWLANNPYQDNASRK